MDMVWVNQSAIEHATDESLEQWTQYLNITIAAVGCTGVVLNALVLLVLRSLKEDKPSLTLMRWLAVCDIIICANFGVRSGILRSLGVRVKELGVVECRAVHYSVILTEYFETGCVCLLTLDRLAAVNWPLVHHVHASSSLANRVSAAVLAFCFLVTSPITVLIPYENGRCADASSHFKAGFIYNIVVKTVLGWLVPLAVIIASNVVILVRMSQRRAAAAAAARGATRNRGSDASHSATTAMLISVSLAFAFFSGLLTLGFVLFIVGPEAVFQRNMQFWFATFNLTRTVNSMINFLLYAATNGNFRRVLLTWANRGRTAGGGGGGDTVEMTDAVYRG